MENPEIHITQELIMSSHNQDENCFGENKEKMIEVTFNIHRQSQEEK